MRKRQAAAVTLVAWGMLYIGLWCVVQPARAQLSRRPGVVVESNGVTQGKQRVLNFPSGVTVNCASNEARCTVDLSSSAYTTGSATVPSDASKLPTTGTWTLGSSIVTGDQDAIQITADPDSANDAVRKSYVDNQSQFLDWGAYCLWCNIADATALYPIVGLNFTNSYSAETRSVSYVERACTAQNIRGRLQGCQATSATRQLTCEPRQNQADITSGPELVFGAGYSGGDWVTDATTVAYSAGDTVNWMCDCAGTDCPMGTFCTIRLQMECAY